MENIRFAGKEHEAFYYNMLKAAGNTDVYHRAFFYTMGISKETRENIHSLFDFEENCIETQNLAAAWQTGGTIHLCRLAFNLWNGWTEGGKERYSAPYELFDCRFAPYFFEAIRLRYPEYCRGTEHPDRQLSAKEL
ncbi:MULTISPECIES: DUF6075 family protein [unclassified Dehalobacter]|jgi:hypothetical protein|uniref:DUF6075 family protein n=1 Tax=unclassified Dehalobacter TaxID=2635733 RepID=UPI00028AECEF|nr:MULTISPECIES: DUF6075 family protein [unclassified Dehalobacter]AFV01070.1 hypothetical protein DHBDCA_p42 [Dehalobacter sp. DCA]AFV04111.1 hypothetical protein DCF50_p105 [Dehalobacter sp. CF]